jgi:hypothetical protein
VEIYTHETKQKAKKKLKKKTEEKNKKPKKHFRKTWFFPPLTVLRSFDSGVGRFDCQWTLIFQICSLDKDVHSQMGSGQLSLSTLPGR